MPRTNHDALRSDQEPEELVVAETRSAAFETPLSSPAQSPDARNEVAEWATEQRKTYTEGVVIERVGHFGIPERWKIASIDEKGTAYLVKEDDEAKHAIMHTTEIALEERAAAFSPQLEQAWDTVFTVISSREDAEDIARMIGKFRADILFAAAERLAGNADADPAQELLHAVRRVEDQVFAETQRQRDGVHTQGESGASPAPMRATEPLPFKSAEAKFYRTHYSAIVNRTESLLREHRGMGPDEAAARAMEEVWQAQGSNPELEAYINRLFDALLSIDAAESTLMHLRVSSDVTAEERPQDEAEKNRVPRTAGEDEAGRLLRVAGVRADVAERLVGAPQLRDAILGGMVETPTTGRSLTEIHAEMDALDRDIGFVELQWKLHGSGDKNSDSALVYLSRVHSMRERLKLLKVQGMLATIQKEGAQRIAEWETKGIAELFERDLAMGAHPLNVATVIDKVVASDALQPNDAHACEALLRQLREDTLRDVGTDELPIPAETAPTPASEDTTVNLPIHAPASESKRRRQKPRALRDMRAAGAPLPTEPATAHESPHLETIALKTPEEVRKEEHEKRVAAARKTGTAQKKMRERVAAARKFVESSPKEKLPFGSDSVAEAIAYRPPETIEPLYRPYPQMRVPGRAIGEMSEDAWLEEGERLRAENENIAAIEAPDRLRTYSTSFRKFADRFGGPKEFVRLFHEAKAKTNLVKFSLEDLRNAWPWDRFRYERQIKAAAREMLRQEKMERAAKKRRGKLQA